MGSSTIVRTITSGSEEHWRLQLAVNQPSLADTRGSTPWLPTTNAVPASSAGKEQPPCKRQVVGSSPTAGSTRFNSPTWWKWQTRQPEELGGASYAGSNPAVGTN
jgi:hypothetical protein